MMTNDNSESSQLVDKDENHGEPFKYDPTFKGPIKNRSCTDIICCIVFLVFLLVNAAIALWAFAYGDPKRLLYPSDSQGNICGQNDLKDKPDLFFFDLMECAQLGAAILVTGCPTEQICVENCPVEDWSLMMELPSLKDEIPPPESVRDKLFCKYDVDLSSSNKSLAALVENGDCASYTLNSTALGGRCVPNLLLGLLDDGLDSIFDKLGVNVTALVGDEYLSKFLVASDYLTKVIEDVSTSWPLIIMLLIAGALISLIWILIMRWFIKPVVWFSLIAFFILFSFSTYYTINQCLLLKGKGTDISDMKLSTDVDDLMDNLDELKDNYTMWVVLAVLSSLLLFIVLIVLVFLRDRLKIAISIIGEASKSIGCIMSTLFWPIIPFIFQLIVIGLWICNVLYLASVAETMDSSPNVQISTDNETGGNETGGETVINDARSKIANYCDPNANDTAGGFCDFLVNGGSEYVTYLQVFQLFMMLWCLNFVIAFGQVSLAGAFASYYWAWDKSKDIPFFALSASVWRAFRYHIGTIAFGSFIIAVIQLIRIIIEYVQHKCKTNDNPVTKFVLKCCACFFWCLEKCMKFLNKRAYILVAVYGKNFCVSAKNAFFLILRNIVRVAIVDKTTDFILIIGELVVTALAGCLAFFLFTGENTGIFASYTNLHFYFIPVIVVIIGTFVICITFFSVYQMAVDTLFLCFLEDLERHDGSLEKPYYMSAELMKIVGVKNIHSPPS